MIGGHGLETGHPRRELVLIVVDLPLESDRIALVEGLHHRERLRVGERVEREGARPVTDLDDEKRVAVLCGLLRRAPQDKHAAEVGIPGGLAERLDCGCRE